MLGGHSVSTPLLLLPSPTSPLMSQLHDARQKALTTAEGLEQRGMDWILDFVLG